MAKGGDFFVDSASWIARAAGIPTFIVGATIVSIATTLPEIIVSCMAAAEGKTEMAIGNAVGSVTVNTAMIMALAFIFMTVVASRKEYMIQCLMLIASAAVLWLGVLSGSLSIWAAIVLLVIFIGFIVLNVHHAKAAAAKGDAKDDTIKKDKKTIAINIIKFIGGAAGIVIGSRLLVNGGSSLATQMGVPERIIAVTLVAIGTSIPELVTTITAIRKKESALSVGNIVGANIIDLTLILPLCSLISGEKLPVTHMSVILDIPVCLGFCCLAVIPLIWKEKAFRAQGIAMLVGYAAYIVCTCVI